MSTRVRRASCCALAAAAVALLSSSCSGSAAGPSYSGAPISITVAALPVVDDVGTYIAAEEGIFKQDGLNVTIKPEPSSTAAIPGMKNGTIDIIAGGNYVSFIEAATADGTAHPTYKILGMAATCATNAFEVLALPSSGIESPADLAGKTIAVNLTNNIQTLMINADLKADNVSTAKINFVAIPFPKMDAALTSGKVNAIAAVEPFATTAAESVGAQSVLDVCSGPTTALPESGYFATTAWVQQNPEAVQRFEKALAQGNEIADTDRAEVEKTLLTYVTGLTHVEAATIALNEFPVGTNGVQINRVSDLMAESGLLKQPFQASALIQG